MASTSSNKGLVGAGAEVPKVSEYYILIGT
jgi:hypothetical protein